MVKGSIDMGASEVPANFVVWFHMPLLGQRLIVWRIAFLAFVWAFWRFRNRIFFRGIDSMRMGVSSYVDSSWHGGLRRNEVSWRRRWLT